VFQEFLPKNLSPDAREIEDYIRKIDCLDNNRRNNMLRANENIIRALGVGQVDLAGMHPYASHEVATIFLRTWTEYPQLLKSIGCCWYTDLSDLHRILISFRYPLILRSRAKENPELSREELEKQSMEFAEMELEKEKGSYSSRYENTVALCSDGGSKNAIIFLDGHHCDIGSYQAAVENIKIKHHPPNTLWGAGITVHELGHAMDNMLCIRFMFEIKNLYEENLSTMTEKLSTYAAENVLEFIAEAWAEYKLSPEPRPLAKRVGSIIERRYGERFSSSRGNFWKTIG
jgi:hypothetical protein